MEHPFVSGPSSTSYSSVLSNYFEDSRRAKAHGIEQLIRVRPVHDDELIHLVSPTSSSFTRVTCSRSEILNHGRENPSPPSGWHSLEQLLSTAKTIYYPTDAFLKAGLQSIARSSCYGGIEIDYSHKKRVLGKIYFSMLLGNNS